MPEALLVKLGCQTQNNKKKYIKKVKPSQWSWEWRHGGLVHAGAGPPPVPQSSRSLLLWLDFGTCGGRVPAECVCVYWCVEASQSTYLTDRGAATTERPSSRTTGGWSPFCAQTRPTSPSCTDPEGSACCRRDDVRAGGVISAGGRHVRALGAAASAPFPRSSAQNGPDHSHNYWTCWVCACERVHPSVPNHSPSPEPTALGAI